MSKSKNELMHQDGVHVDESMLLQHVSNIIENRKKRAGAYANLEVTLMYWEVGNHVNSVVLDGSRAAYGKRIVATLASQLQIKYGKTFDVHNLRRMMRFAERFEDAKIVTELASQLSWSHFIELLPLKSNEARMFYAKEVLEHNLGTKELRKQISRKAFERREIANTQITDSSAIPFNAFKDPFLLDVFGLKDNYLEGDLEQAILIGLEKFILEYGNGLTFVAKQKRITMDGVDFKLDLLFYSRELRRLIAIDLKIGAFKPAHKGQMEFYLKWLSKYNRYEGENDPIGLILCAKANRGQVELMELDKSGIAVAEYWTVLPPKDVFEKKIQEILFEARERLERRKMLPNGNVQWNIEFFYDKEDDDD